jgi:hypothetical protein
MQADKHILEIINEFDINLVILFFHLFYNQINFFKEKLRYL